MGTWFEYQALSAFSEAKKKSSMIARSCGIDSAALIETRRWEPLSSPLVYQEFRARSLLMTHRSWPRAGVDAARRLARRDVPEPVGLTEALVHEQIDVIEQELATLDGGNLAQRAAGREVGRLLEDPRIAERAAADKHAADAGAAEAFARSVRELDAVAAAEHGNRHARRDPRDQTPSPTIPNTIARRSGRGPRPPPRRHLPSGARAPAR